MKQEATETISRFAAPIARVVSTYERDRGLQEDLMQEIAVAIVTALPKLRDRSRLAPFVFRIAHNKCVDHVVRHRRAPRLVEWSVDPPSEDTSAEQQIIQRQDSEMLLAAVRQLPLPLRQVVSLVLEDLSHAEIAASLGLSFSNVALRVNRAKEQLRILLNHDRR